MHEALFGCDRRAEPEEVADIVRTAFASARGDLSTTEAALLAEVEELGRMIAAARVEITALRVDDITDRDIPAVTDELDAIVAHTAVATESILESCETLDRIAAELSGGTAATLQDATTRIYEACGFQDITGQRITKVVTTLKSIDAKVAGIIAAFGARRVAASSLSPAPPVPIMPELLHGPQLPANAMDQTDIDKLLASFD
jgi:chemotaxis protein CheZ